MSRDRLWGIWRRTLALSWPIGVQQAFTTLMRTVDVLVAGLFAPAYVTAVGLADLYAQVPLRVGLALAGFVWGDWAERAAGMMAEREAVAG